MSRQKVEFAGLAKTSLCGLLPLLVAACGPEPEGNNVTYWGDNNAVQANNAMSVAPAPSSNWTVTNGRDPLTDASVTDANTMVAGTMFDAAVRVTCSTKDGLQYRLDLFDKEGKGAPVRIQLGKSPFSNDPVPYFGYRIRFDGGQPSGGAIISPRYSNEVMLDDDDAPKAVQANQLIVALQLKNGDETYTIDQSDGIVRNAMRACMSAPPQTVEPAAPSDPVNAANATNAMQ